jgi:hypothetical protein
VNLDTGPSCTLPGFHTARATRCDATVRTHAPDGKPAGLSPTACRLLTNQRPTLTGCTPGARGTAIPGPQGSSCELPYLAFLDVPWQATAGFSTHDRRGVPGDRGRRALGLRARKRVRNDLEARSLTPSTFPGRSSYSASRTRKSAASVLGVISTDRISRSAPILSIRKTGAECSRWCQAPRGE